jgi:hypothetical protein
MLGAIFDALSTDTYPRTAAAIVSQDQWTFAPKLGHNRQAYIISSFLDKNLMVATLYYLKSVSVNAAVSARRKAACLIWFIPPALPGVDD